MATLFRTIARHGITLPADQIANLCRELDVALGAEIVAQEGTEDGELQDIELAAEIGNLVRRQGDPVPGDGPE